MGIADDRHDRRDMDLRRRAVYAASKRRHQVLSFSRWTPPSSPAVSLTSAPKGILLAANVGRLATSQSPPPPPALLLPDGSQTTSPLHHGAQPLTLRASSSAAKWPTVIKFSCMSGRQV
ncbi:hypothetical protein EJB05_13663 [Eragrostis curvula]|uniref:Uncharacterized protein n=1 Tax=Eragrostis curvula TaxID=38414 RepID=A0A5J9VUW2_9POAL|nr:hypothetical protein EJB05_13663 [Eragrostis curvula]